MEYQGYLLVANVVVWAAVGGYIIFLGKQQKRLEMRLLHLEQCTDDSEAE